MFTKENLIKWINALHEILYGGVDIDSDEEKWHNLAELEQTLEKLHTSMTSDNSI